MVRRPEREGSEGRMIQRRVRATTEGLQRVAVPANDAGFAKAVGRSSRRGRWGQEGTPSLRIHDGH